MLFDEPFSVEILVIEAKSWHYYTAFSCYVNVPVNRSSKLFYFFENKKIRGTFFRIITSSID
ncbi:MAG: hypothetical protein A2W85_07420 [Bacteroidetes bacterium GWF2_41_31]|nr:MAG: hypothetical protein A2W85_07420 [Bacteroidetes bacterium GWF2_41_31]OFZ09173.1 MAG: hypothetical protein A2338_05480 [Bacteroidetes bacterium RIFOXYB12_FULL_41_6]